MLAFFFEACYNMRVIKRNARCFRLVTSLSSSFSPLSYMDRAQNRKALCPIHFAAKKRKKQRRCGERKTGKKGEVKGLKRGKGSPRAGKREKGSPREGKDGTGRKAGKKAKRGAGALRQGRPRRFIGNSFF